MASAPTTPVSWVRAPAASATAAAIRSAFFGGYTYAQLAERMNVPLGTMKSWVRRGLAQLKMCIGDD